MVQNPSNSSNLKQLALKGLTLILEYLDLNTVMLGSAYYHFVRTNTDQYPLRINF